MTESAATDWKADVREAARLLIRRGWLLALAPLLAAGLTALALCLAPARYSAQALIAGGAQVPPEALTALATSAEMERRLTGDVEGAQPAQVAEAMRGGAVDALDGGLTRLTLRAADAQQAVAFTRAWAEQLVALVSATYPDRTRGGENAPRVISLPDEATREDNRLIPKVITAAVLGLLAGAIVILSYRVTEPTPQGAQT
jgi:hypothetical protein